MTWPIVSKEIGNDLPELYSKINTKTAAIKSFLLKNGIKESEINLNAPVVLDMSAERYNYDSRQAYRYNITSIITVTSNNVKGVRNIIADQGQFSIDDRDSNTPYIKKVRVVTTVTYSLKD